MRAQPLLVVVLAVLAAACGSSSSPPSSSSPAATSTTTAHHGITRVATRRVAGGIGAILVSGQGRTLYVFLPEKGGKVRCVGGCASLWPPLSLRSGEKPTTTSPLHPSLVGTVANPSGGSIITYAGWPLHTFARDASSGSFKGQGYGGQWYMISPSGQVITKPVNSTSSGGSSSSYGY